MNFVKTLFAQLMEFMTWTSFARIVVRHGGDSGVRNLSRTEQFRAMAFAQLTYCESLRDIGLFADQRQRSTQLEHLGRLGDVVDPACAQTVLQRQLRCRSDQYGLRIGCDDYRPVPVAVSMGTVSHQQSGVKLHTLLVLRGNISELFTSRMARLTKY